MGHVQIHDNMYLVMRERKKSEREVLLKKKKKYNVCMIYAI